MRHEEQQPANDASGPPPRLAPPHAARLLAGERCAPARVLSLGDEVLVIATRVLPHLGDEVTVDLSARCSLTGRVIWTAPAKCGRAECALKLSVPINSAALVQRLVLAQQAQRAAAGQRRRWRRRWAPEQRVVVRSALGVQIVRLRDGSPGDARIVHDGRFRPGMAIRLLLAPGVERAGVLSWSRDGIAGVRLTDAAERDRLADGAHG